MLKQEIQEILETEPHLLPAVSKETDTLLNSANNLNKLEAGSQSNSPERVKPDNTLIPTL